ncbi:MAG: tRNA(m5U54)methyltransferase [Cirrosporium novae-zelandiae]|nr:MAG: tRNA(m5U54)methyltransferase [Cirrosporium novae-zelandiae]
MARPKRRFNQGPGQHKKQKAKQGQNGWSEGSTQEVLLKDVQKILSQQRSPSNLIEHEGNEIPDSADNSMKQSIKNDLPERFSEITLQIERLSSTGDGLGFTKAKDHVYVVPFTAPGDKVLAKVVTHFPIDAYTLTDFVKIIEPSPLRDDSRVKCQYFSRCSGCQFQMLSYEEQLKHKKHIIEEAYRNFSNLDPSLVPAVADTIGSPKQYEYRTKLTPHFDGPPGGRRAKRSAEGPVFKEVPSIGFMMKGRRTTMDIEDCPIGTDAVRMGMKNERKRVARELNTYKRGATLLLRESTRRIPKNPDENNIYGTTREFEEVNTSEESVIRRDFPTYIEESTCITNPNGTTTEYIDNFSFTNPAGSFFQNNNSILPLFTSYIRNHCPLPPSQPSSETSASPSRPIKNLIDAYCGSGLFTITLSSLFTSSSGIDIAESSIISARTNATANSVPNAKFIAADAAALFADVQYPPSETLMVIDPPRKGCDENFLRQLLDYGPKRLVYVSCNVHTQARDVGYLIVGNEKCKYSIESLQGFDFFPQTGHVESVAVLNRDENNNNVENP